MICITYFILDEKLFYYGRSDFIIYNSLPMQIIPDNTNDFEYSFTLKDKYGFTIAAKGNSYEFNDTILKIKSVVSYSFNDEILVACILDEFDSLYYIEFKENNSNQSNIEISAKALKKIGNYCNLRSIDTIKDKKFINRIIIARNIIKLIFIVLMIISLFILIYYLLKNIKKR